jgi:hypothetical protein
MTKALDTHIFVNEEYEISLAFASIVGPKVERTSNLEEEDCLTNKKEMEV